MKHLSLLIILVFFCISYLFPQVKNGNNSETLNSLKELSSFSGNAEQIFVLDSASGGTFFKYNGSLPVDNGIIIKDAKGVKWKRYIADNRIRPEWYGASSALADNYEPFRKAINYIYATYNTSGGTIPPYANAILKLSGIRYNFKQTLVFNYHIKIEGEGTRYEPTTILYFPKNTTGLKFVSSFEKGAYSADVKNIMVGMDFINDGYDSSAHAIVISCVVNFENVTVNFASGNGIHIDACADPRYKNYGNADGSMFINCKVVQCNNGVFINGCDANQIVFQSLWALGNRRWGIYDNGFLGNHYYNPQCDLNGNNESVVSYGTNPVKYYLAIHPEEEVNREQKPDAQNSQFWREIPRRASTPWKPGKRYYTGGAYAIVNINAFATVFGAYTEEGSAPALILSQRVITIGGDQGSGVVGGKYIFANSEGLVLTSNLITTGQNKIGIGTIPQSPLEINYRYKDSYINNIARFRCDDCESTNLVFSNSTMDIGVFGYYKKGFLTIAGKVPVSITDSSGFRPFIGNQFNLGDNDFRWNNVYANNWKGGVITPVYGGTGLSRIAPNVLLLGGETSGSPLKQLDDPGIPGQVLTSNGPGKIPAWKGVAENPAKGSSLPVMTTAERNSIGKPAEGSMIYNKTTHKINIFTGFTWEQVVSN